MPDPDWSDKNDTNWPNKTDDELIAIINSDNMTVPNSIKNAARSELHRRQKKKDNSMLFMTAVILILTIALAYAEFFHKPSPTTVPPLDMQSQQLNPTEKKNTPQAKKEIPKARIEHNVTSPKQK